MQMNEFIDFINDKTGMTLRPDDELTDFTDLESWDSLTFVYMVLELEKEQKMKFPMERLMGCNNLKELYGVMKDVVGKN